MRRGSVSERSLKCGKADCACARDPNARHGPYQSLTQAVGGKTRSRSLTPEQTAVAQQLSTSCETDGQRQPFAQKSSQHLIPLNFRISAIGARPTSNVRAPLETAPDWVRQPQIHFAGTPCKSLILTSGVQPKPQMNLRWCHFSTPLPRPAANLATPPSVTGKQSRKNRKLLKN
jgi:hypothetical protein